MGSGGPCSNAVLHAGFLIKGVVILRNMDPLFNSVTVGNTDAERIFFFFSDGVLPLDTRVILHTIYIKCVAVSPQHSIVLIGLR